MSRIGKLPIDVPGNAKVTVVENRILVEGPRGKLEKEFKSSVIVQVKDDQIIVSRADSSRFSNAYYGTMRAIINNMVKGVVEGYSKELELHGVGFKAILKNNVLVLNLGYSHDIKYNIPYSDIKVTVTESTKIKVEGPDKHAVGQVSADIYHFYPVEPYKGKGVRIKGKYIIRKEGKKTA